MLTFEYWIVECGIRHLLTTSKLICDATTIAFLITFLNSLVMFNFLSIAFIFTMIFRFYALSAATVISIVIFEIQAAATGILSLLSRLFTIHYRSHMFIWAYCLRGILYFTSIRLNIWCFSFISFFIKFIFQSHLIVISKFQMLWWLVSDSFWKSIFLLIRR